MTDLTLSLGQIRGASPCPGGWLKLLRSLGYASGQFDLSRRVTLGDIADSNGAADAWWCVRCLDLSGTAVRRAIIAALLPSVKRASSHTADARVHTCIATIGQWVAGDEAMDPQGSRAASWAAAEAASQAARAASWAASQAAWAASWAAEAASWAAEAASQAAPLSAAGAAEAASQAERLALRAAGAVETPAEREAQRRDLINAFGQTGSDAHLETSQP